MHQFETFRVEPNGKRPAAAGWQAEAASGAPVPEGFNVGVHCRDLLVLDVDAKGGAKGFESLAALQALYGDLPDTYTVDTPSGGRHYYFRGGPVKNSAGKLGPGLDVRSTGGYVLAAGSVIDGVPYRAACDVAMVEAPDWLVNLCGRPDERPQSSVTTPAVPADLLDQPETVAQAIAYLGAQDAPQQGGRNVAVFRLAVNLKDLGLTEPTVLSILTDYNEARVAPPLDEWELSRTVQSAYSSGQNAPGSRHPASFGFEPAEIAPRSPSDTSTGATPSPGSPNPPQHPLAGAATNPPQEDYPPVQATQVEPFDPASIPKREWIVEGTCTPGAVTMIAAPPGVGKTIWTVALALAVATGRGEIIGAPVLKRGPVWLYNNEDDRPELFRRLAAAMQQFDITWNDIGPNLYLDTGAERRLKIATRRYEVTIPQDADGVVAQLRATGAVLFVADPLIETHDTPENDNVGMAQVLGLYRRIATSTGVSVTLIQHSKKGTKKDHDPDDMDAMRGAGAIAGVARIVKNLRGMDGKDAARYGIGDPDEILRYVRMDDAKSNYSLRAGHPRWYRKESVVLPSLDDVGVLVPVKLEDVTGAVERSFLRDVVEAVGEGDWPLAAVVAGLRATPAYVDDTPDAVKKRVIRSVGRDGVSVALGGDRQAVLSLVAPTGGAGASRKGGRPATLLRIVQIEEPEDQFRPVG